MSCRGPDLKITEHFLLSQPEVLDVTVWVENGRVFASVTVSEDTTITNRALLNACKKELGLRYTPAELMLSRSKLKAA